MEGGHDVFFLNPRDGIYLVGQPIYCRISFTPNFAIKARDWIGLYRSSYLTVDDYITFQWVETASLDESRDDEDKPSLERVIPFRGHLPSEDSDNNYVFVYVSNHQVLATSSPFQFRNYQRPPPNIHEVNLHSFVALVSDSVEGENEGTTNGETTKKVGFEEKTSSPVKSLDDKAKPLRQEVQGMEFARQHGEVYPSTTSSFEVIASMNQLSVLEDDNDQPGMEDCSDQPGLKITIENTQSVTSADGSAQTLQRTCEAEPSLPNDVITDNVVSSTSQCVTGDSAFRKPLGQRPSTTLSGSYSNHDLLIMSTTESANIKQPSRTEEPAQSSSSLKQQLTGIKPLQSIQSQQLSYQSHSSIPSQQIHQLPTALSGPHVNSMTREPANQLQPPTTQRPKSMVTKHVQPLTADHPQPSMSKGSAQLQQSLSEPTTESSQLSLDVISPSIVVVATPSTSSMQDYKAMVTSGAHVHYNSFPTITTSVTMATSPVVATSSMSHSSPAFSGQQTDLPVITPADFLQKSSFVNETEYNRVLRYCTSIHKELHLAKLAFQREHTMAERAMEMGQSHKKQVDMLQLQLAQQDEDVKMKSAKLTRLEEAHHQLELAFQESDKHVSALLKSDVELRETKHRLKKAVQRREDNLRNQSEERDSLRATVIFLKDELRQVEQVAGTQLRKMSAFPKEEIKEGEARFLVQTLARVVDSRFSRQNEALLTLQEEHTAESRRWLAEKNELHAQCRQLEERAQRAEQGEADALHSLERISERQRHTMKEKDDLRQRLQEAQRVSGRASYNLYDLQAGTTQNLGNSGSLSQEAVLGVSSLNEDTQVSNESPPTSAILRRQGPALSNVQLSCVATGSSLLPSSQLLPVSTESAQRAPIPSMFSGSVPDSAEKPPPEGLTCPVCGKESSHYLTMRMWQWHVNGHFN